MTSLSTRTLCISSIQTHTHPPFVFVSFPFSQHRETPKRLSFFFYGVGAFCRNMSCTAGTARIVIPSTNIQLPHARTPFLPLATPPPQRSLSPYTQQNSRKFPTHPPRKVYMHACLLKLNPILHDACLPDESGTNTATRRETPATRRKTPATVRKNTRNFAHTRGTTTTE